MADHRRSAIFVMAYDDFEQDKRKTFWTADEAVDKIRRYCALQERSHSEVRSKLLDNGIYGDLLEEIISDLIADNFLDEERFARSFARGKFRMKKWGKNKIRQELKLRQVSDYSIRAGLSEIDDAEYMDVLHSLYEKKEKTSKFLNKYDKMKKLTDYLLQKGYEYELINALLRKNDT
ncbi:MAG: RecX family transcriptional regulator [Saprospiraceae bacterium]|nr:MAG: regulatory protein RecX [Bacteroidetes bacterium OLB9]MCO6463932.1 RecX family transcriptional regulator [Saprospiraceae bacterium]MCZ2337110.1 RecX family transcriptional regulator [Chitinophagales bacterium]